MTSSEAKASYKINIPNCQRFREGKSIGFAGFSALIVAIPLNPANEFGKPNMTNPDSNQSHHNNSINPLEMAGLGMEIAAPILLGAWVSTYWQLGPWPTLAGLAFGLVGATAHVIVFLRRQQASVIRAPRSRKPHNEL